MSKRKRFTSDAMRNVFLHGDEYNKEPPAIPKRDEEPEEPEPKPEESPEEKPAEPPKKPKAKSWDVKTSLYLTNEEYELFRRYAFESNTKISRAIIDAAVAHIQALAGEE